MHFLFTTNGGIHGLSSLLSVLILIGSLYGVVRLIADIYRHLPNWRRRSKERKFRRMHHKAP